MEKVAVIIVNWNGGELLTRCLQSLKAQTRLPDRILVVDNDSQDGSWQQANTKSVELIRLPLNIGFAAANNLAVKQAKDADWVALLNPDAFPAPQWLENLLRYAHEHPTVAAIGSCQLDARHPHLLDGTGDIYHVSGKAWRDNQGRPVAEWENDALASEMPIFSPCAAAALYRRSAFLAVGGFDEQFFCYMEDVDLGFRLRLAGYEIGFAPTALVEHVGSALSGGGDSPFALYYGHRNLLWVYAKNMPRALWWKYLPQHLFLNGADIVYFALRGRLGTILRAKWHGVLGLVAMSRQRQIIQKNAVLSAPLLEKVLAHGPQRPYLEKLARRTSSV